MINRLIGFGELANQSLENSIMGNYQGVFLPKTQPTANQNQQQPQPRRGRRHQRLPDDPL